MNAEPPFCGRRGGAGDRERSADGVAVTHQGVVDAGLVLAQPHLGGVADPLTAGEVAQVGAQL
ncbi:MAG: hypothetical protein WBO08_18710, partial [Mycobacterium sp.]